MSNFSTLYSLENGDLPSGKSLQSASVQEYARQCVQVCICTNLHTLLLCGCAAGNECRDMSVSLGLVPSAPAYSRVQC